MLGGGTDEGATTSSTTSSSGIVDIPRSRSGEAKATSASKVDMGDVGIREVRGAEGITPLGEVGTSSASCEKKEGEVMSRLTLLVTGEEAEASILLGVGRQGSTLDVRGHGGGAHAPALLREGIGEERGLNGVGG